MKRHLRFKFFDTKEEAERFEKSQPRHLRGSVTPWTSEKEYTAGLHDNDNPEKWVAWYKI